VSRATHEQPTAVVGVERRKHARSLRDHRKRAPADTSRNIEQAGKRLRTRPSAGYVRSPSLTTRPAKARPFTERHLAHRDTSSGKENACSRGTD
jgi:hypothetical protein